MNNTINILLACPQCGSELNLKAITHEGVEVFEGWLTCNSGCGQYPISNGIPRLLPEMCKSTSTQEIRKKSLEIQSQTKESFSNQWEMHKHGETTWGVTVEERIHVALHELGWTEKEIKGKTVLDAGCGNGSLSAAIAEKGATVLALDLSNSIERAYTHYHGPNLHFIQGNLYYPPFKKQVFNAIYSCGVFHHTPNTRKCFDTLVPTLKPTRESRYFVWLYSKRSLLFNFTVEQFMKVTRRLPSRILMPLCGIIAPLVEAVARSLTSVRILDEVPRSFNDRTVILHDLLSPRYVHYHTVDEAKNWCNEAGLTRIEQIAYRESNNGNKQKDAVMEKYRRICRPGFGLLAKYPNKVTA